MKNRYGIEYHVVSVQEPRSPWTGHQTTKKELLPLTAALLDGLQAGATFTWLDIMGGIGEMVAFYTDCDQNQMDPTCDLQERSQNKCRFCS